jgi:hypothetical protein
VLTLELNSQDLTRSQEVWIIQALSPLFPEFGKVQTEPNFQGRVRIENGSKFHSSQLCRPQVTTVVSVDAVFLVGE